MACARPSNGDNLARLGVVVLLDGCKDIGGEGKPDGSGHPPASLNIPEGIRKQEPVVITNRMSGSIDKYGWCNPCTRHSAFSPRLAEWQAREADFGTIPTYVKGVNQNFAAEMVVMP